MISPLAYVSPKAQIGKNVTIDAFAYIDDNVIIGDNCVLREFVTIHRGTASKGKTVVGNNNLIMAYCHVAHDCALGNNIIMSN